MKRMKYTVGSQTQAAHMEMQVHFRGPRDANWQVAMGKLDTGASNTVLPEALLKTLSGCIELLCETEGAMGQSLGEKYARRIRVSLDGGKNFSEVWALPTPKSHGLIGLDILNNYILHANGPARRFSLRRPCRLRWFT